MIFVHGARHYGKVAKLNQQWVETKFYHLYFIPIFPIESTLIISSQSGIQEALTLPTHKKSVIATYCRVFSLILTAWICYQLFGNTNNLDLFFAIEAILVLAACMYFYLFYARSTTEEIEFRNKIGSATGLYVLPAWFDHQQAKDQLYKFEYFYKDNYPGQDWKTDIFRQNLNTEQQALLFAIALFNCMTYDVPENEALFARADEQYQPDLPSSAVL